MNAEKFISDEKSNMSTMNLNQFNRNIIRDENSPSNLSNPGWEEVTDTRMSPDENYKTAYNP